MSRAMVEVVEQCAQRSRSFVPLIDQALALSEAAVRHDANDAQALVRSIGSSQTRQRFQAALVGRALPVLRSMTYLSVGRNASKPREILQ
jgi:hypothetical protein